eukprot:augustus_masked-scaffold_9-processed-gene-11.8-mRNA-1 protein AED:0.27 eAED:0.42 QI:0/-1/0/1/-1/1/1/0/471
MKFNGQLFRQLATLRSYPKLDVKKINENLKLVEENINYRKVVGNPQEVVRLSTQLNSLRNEQNALQRRRNELGKKGKDKSVESRKLEAGNLKNNLKEISKKISYLEALYKEEASLIPNYLFHGTPKDGDDRVMRTSNDANERVNSFQKKSDEMMDHFDICKELDLLELDRATKISGQGFVGLKSDLCALELALVQFALDRAKVKGFTQIFYPDVVRRDAVFGCGFNPRAHEKNSEIYKLESSDLCLAGTSEIALVSQFCDEIIDFSPKRKSCNPLFQCFHEDEPEENDLSELCSAEALLFTSFSHCFRKEAGNGGRKERGLFRLHQFSKVELVAVCKPEDSQTLQEAFTEFVMCLLDELRLIWRTVEVSSDGLGMSAFRKIDVEVFLPGKRVWVEVASISDCTDFQSRRLNIRYKPKEEGSQKSKSRFVHTVNGTALATPRIMIALLETHQKRSPNSLTFDLPSVLKHYIH